MDPLTAFSVASSVIQVVDYSTKIVEKCLQLYRGGASTENQEIESMAKHLTNLSTDLILPPAIQSPGPAAQLYEDDQGLLELARQCSETAAELIGELQKLTIQGRRKKREAFRKAIKIVWKKNAVEGIQKRLEQYRRTLDTGILVDLRQYVHLIYNEQSDDFRNLDRKLRNLIIGVARNQNTFDELKVLIQVEIASGKQHVSQEFEKYRERIAAEDSHKRLLESLYFSDIHARQEGIATAHKETYEWIFDKPGNEVRPWHSFIGWLESGHGIYWISGKAGSGKSTLMSFICQDPRTKIALRVWSGTSQILMPKFFFWSPGTQLQKSLGGLLRSLIYQIVERLPDSVPAPTSYMSPTHHRLLRLPTWTSERLYATLQHLLTDGLREYRLCIFIDGLDEFYGDQSTLSDQIRDLRQNTRVKFCLSSRPDQIFRQELGSSAMLRLQDLTDRDVRKYASDKLERAPMKALQISDPSFSLKYTIDTIVRKAEGVFLWVDLAVRDQLQGIRNGDDARQLRERLQLLPEEIEGLYGHLLSRIEKVYWREVAQYFQLVLDNKSHTLFDIALAVHKRIDDILLLAPSILISDIRNHCMVVGERIATTSQGFLEVREGMDHHNWQKLLTGQFKDTSPFWSSTALRSLEARKLPLEQRDDLMEVTFYQMHSRVHFLHRTAFDFFRGNEQGKEFLKANTSANSHPRVLHLKAQLADLMFTRDSTSACEVQIALKSIMSSAINAEYATGIAQPALMDLLDRSVATLCQRSPGQPSNSHWCRAWRCSHCPYLAVPSPLCQREIQRPSEPKNDGNSTIYPVDFLSFAAWYGLHKYVEHTIDTQPGRRNLNTMNYLLSCAVGGFVEPVMGYRDKNGRYALLSTLLKRGADPSINSSEGTIWGTFLQNLYKVVYTYDTHDPFLEATEAIQAFFGSGANVNERICIELAYYVRRSVSSTPLWLTKYSIRLHLSALSALKQCFAESPEFPEFEEAFIASGASLYSECTNLLFEVEDKGGQRRWLDPKLPKQQLSTLLEILEERREDFLRIRKNKYSLERLAVEWVQELDVETLYEQACQEEAVQGAIVQEEESREDESSSQSISNGPSTDAPDSPTLEGEPPAHSTQTPQIEH